MVDPDGDDEISRLALALFRLVSYSLTLIILCIFYPQATLLKCLFMMLQLK